MMHTQNTPLVWLSTLYFAKGIAYVMVMFLSLIMLRQMGLSSSAALSCVALFHIPWVSKFWWKPYVVRPQHFTTWIDISEIFLALSFAALSFLMTSTCHTVAMLLLIAWLTAIHNVAVDGLYRQVTRNNHLPTFVRVKELARKLAVIVGQGVLVMMVGNMQVFYRYDRFYSWEATFYILAGLFLLFCMLHHAMLPRHSHHAETNVHRSLPSLHDIGAPFLFLYPFAVGLQAKVGILFLLDAPSSGGLGLSPQEFGLVMGTVGITGLTIGGMMGFRVLRRDGLARWLWPMALLMVVPCAVYALMGYWEPSSLLVISLGVFLEQTTYGFGFAAYLWVLRHVSNREVGKSLMALSLMLSCLLSGVLQSAVGYYYTFLVALVVSAVPLVSTWTIRKIPTLK